MESLTGNDTECGSEASPVILPSSPAPALSYPVLSHPVSRSSRVFLLIVSCSLQLTKIESRRFFHLCTSKSRPMSPVSVRFVPFRLALPVATSSPNTSLVPEPLCSWSPRHNSRLSCMGLTYNAMYNGRQCQDHSADHASILTIPGIAVFATTAAATAARHMSDRHQSCSSLSSYRQSCVCPASRQTLHVSIR